jgi:hypothetical protein
MQNISAVFSAALIAFNMDAVELPICNQRPIAEYHAKISGMTKESVFYIAY